MRCDLPGGVPSIHGPVRDHHPMPSEWAGHRELEWRVPQLYRYGDFSHRSCGFWNLILLDCGDFPDCTGINPWFSHLQFKLLAFLWLGWSGEFPNCTGMGIVVFLHRICWFGILASFDYGSCSDYTGRKIWLVHESSRVCLLSMCWLEWRLPQLYRHGNFLHRSCWFWV